MIFCKPSFCLANIFIIIADFAHCMHIVAHCHVLHNSILCTYLGGTTCPQFYQVGGDFKSRPRPIIGVKIAYRMSKASWHQNWSSITVVRKWWRRLQFIGGNYYHCKSCRWQLIFIDDDDHHRIKIWKRPWHT